jgi:hypothetical protein
LLSGGDINSTKSDYLIVCRSNYQTFSLY